VRLWLARVEHDLGEVAQMADQKMAVWTSFANVD
jgi:hypothetical protein